MGYTHYWSKESNVDSEIYAKVFKKLAKIVTANSKILAGGFGEKGTKPEIKNDIIFNGIEDDSHETFSIPKNPDGLESFDFCKTARKEYDKVVVACLTVIHNYLKGVKVSSDGDKEELEEGRLLAEKILGEELVNICDEVPCNSLKFIKKLKVTKK